jgi:hypothetical protein
MYFSSLTSSSPGSNTGSYIILKSFIFPDGSKNRFRISSLCALIFGTVLLGGGAAGAEPEPSDSAPELASGENNRATTEALDMGLTEPGARSADPGAGA